MCSARSSRLRARVDLYFRLRGDALDAPLIGLTEYVPMSVTWTRNRAAEADTCEVELLSTDLPFDLGVIAARGGVMHVWLYEHQNAERCRRGDNGHFVGVIDGLDRQMASNRVSIKARDFTAFLLDTKVSEGDLAKIKIGEATALSTIVRQLVALVPGAEQWEIEELTSSASARLPQPQVRPKKQVKGTAGTPPKKALRPRYRHMASLLPGQGEVSVWDAITAVCARLGVVPEVVPAKDDKIAKIVLVAAEDLHMSAVLRPFDRDGNRFRVLTVGEDVSEVGQQLELTSHDKRPDFIQVASINRETGVAVVGEWPHNRARKAETGLFQTVEGLTSNEDCQRLARSAWEALAQNEQTTTITVPHPWSTGGGPDDPDLLDCGYGAAVELKYAGFDRVASSPTAVLESRGIQPAVAARIAAAQEHLGRLSLLYLVVSTEHRWATGSSPEYSCKLNVRRTLGGVGV